MCQIQLPDALIQQIHAAGVTGGAVDEFVRQAIQEKLAGEERRKMFFHLSNDVRAAMDKQGLAEQQILVEFDALRHST